jgi:hypothetical protein
VRRALAGLLVLGSVGAAGDAGAGELMLTNGSRLEADLASEVLFLTTATGTVEIAGDQVVLLTREEVWLRDGRVVRGTLAEGRVLTRTSLGVLAFDAGELREFRATAPSGVAGPPAEVSGAATSATASTRVPEEPAGAPVARLAGVRATLAPRRLEVIAGESALFRDAYAAAARVGRVLRGELVTYVDFIDRRLKILNVLVLDGGHWVKIRAVDGTEGWIPADLVREVP